MVASRFSPTLVPAIISVATSVACRTDGAAVATLSATGITTGDVDSTAAATSSEGSEGTTSSSASASSADSTSESSSSGEAPPGDPLVCSAITRPESCGELGPAPQGTFEVTPLGLPPEVSVAAPCDCREIARTPDFEVFAPDDWPNGPETAPLAVLAHGNNYDPTGYFNVVELLVSMGFVVVNVDLDAGLQRTDDAACAIEAMNAAFGSALRCELVLVGHSSGAGDLLSLAELSDQEPYASILRPFDLRGYVSLAPGNPTDPLDLAAVPRAPALFFGSTTDVQPSGRPGEHFDQLAPESNATSYPEHRAVVWVDGTLHGDFVGVPGPALAAIQGYVPPFLRSQAFNGSDELWWSYATMDAWPPEVVDDDIWDDIEVTYNLHADVDCSAIEIGCDTTPGCVSAPDDTCIDEPRIKTMVAPPSVYRHPVKLFEETDASEFDNPSDMTVVVDAATQATFGLGPTNAADSRLIRVDYGSPDPVGQLRFPVTEDMFDKTHLSLRAGNVLEHDNLCNAASEEAVRFDVSLARGGLESSVAVSTGRLPQQFLNQALNTCPATQAMQTVRFNLGQWCEDFGGDDIDEIVLTFEEPVEPARVIIDTIELTNVPEDEIENLPPCGVVGEGGMWACEIDDLAITETSCAGEPTGAPASCSSANLRTNAVDPPEVEFPGEDAFSGWAVHTRPGVVVDVFDPTAEELDRVRARCIEACELEYANQPDISAECDDADAFLTPTLLSEDSHASAFQIPRSMIHGEWAITEEALDCDLRVDCCEAFDEGLCPARPWRSTEARMPLGRGQEWSYTTTGVIVIDSEAMAEPVMGDITGTLGGSLCDAGTATEACPVYLGSATVELADPLTVSLACGGQTVVHTLDELSLSLAQPAFGLKSHDEPDWSAFPPGSLVFDAHTVVDAIEIDTFLPNEDGVTMKFNAGWAQVPLFSHFEVTIDVPCGGQMVPVSAWFGLVDDDVLGSPPSGVAITVPSTLTCPQTRALTGTASDADSDIASVRWKVDDVLLAPGTTSMAFTQDHDLTAIVRDARGATRTVHKHVDCL